MSRRAGRSPDPARTAGALEPAATPALRRGLVWLLPLLLASPFAWPLLRAGVYVGNGTDLTSYQVPMRRLVAATLAALELPLWNPWMLGGAPLLGAWQLGILYPPSWPGMALGAWAGLDAGLALDIERAAHGLWLVLGGLALGNALRPGRLLAVSASAVAVALLLAGSGVSWGHVYAGHTSFLAVWAWLPWVWALTLRALDRRSLQHGWAAAAALAMALLAGHPQLVLIGGVGLVLATAGWSLRQVSPDGRGLDLRRWGADVGVAALAAIVLLAAAAALAAAQLLPTAALVDDLNRSLDNGGNLGLAFSPPVASMLTLLTPEAFGPAEARTMGFSWHESVGSVAPGLLALAFAATASRSAWIWLLGALALASFVPGSNLPILERCIDALPVLGAFRVPSRWWVAVTLLLALPLADAAGRWAMPRASATSATMASSRHAARICALIAVALLALVAFGLAMNVTSQTPWWAGALARDVGAGERETLAAATQVALLWAGLEIALVGLGVALPHLRRPLLALALLAAAGHGLALGASVQPASRMWPASRLRWPTELATALRDGPDPTASAAAVAAGGAVAQRIVTAPALRQTNWGGGDGIRVAGGYETAMPLWSNRYFNRSNGRPQDRYLVNLQLRRPSPWLDRAAVDTLVRGADDRAVAQAFASWPGRGTAADRVLQRNPRAFPRLAVARATQVEPDRARAIDALADLAPDVVVLDAPLEQAAAAVGAGTAADRLTVVRDGSREVEIDATTERPGVLVLRDAMAAGWTATLDGAPTPIAVADGLFRAVALPAGTHRVRFWYEPPGWALGAWLSLAAWLAWLAAGLWLRQRSQRPA